MLFKSWKHIDVSAIVSLHLEDNKWEMADQIYG